MKPEFALETDDKTGTHTIFDGEIPVLTERNRDVAKAYYEHLLVEHANGRVAQARCRHGHNCDRDRINDMARFAASGGREVVLCEAHKSELDGSR